MFDHAFDTETEQENFYNITAKPVIKQIFEGLNGTILAYGQTGSGKTFSMQGIQRDPALRGVIPRAISDIFDTISNSPANVEFIVKMSVVEVYKEMIRDLIELKSDERIEIREDLQGNTILDGVEESYVGNELEVAEIMMNALANRRVGRTNMNEHSSRSHVVTIMNIEQNIKSESKILKGKLFMVDLAGSECLNKTGAVGERMEEAKHINKGLLTIGRVINALTEGTPFIPYRDSKLTRLLKESLGGNSKTTLIITCSPSIYNEMETVSTLRFGVRAKLIKNKVTVNLELSKEQLVKLVEQKNERIAYLEEYVKFLEQFILKIVGKQLPKFVFGAPWKFDLFTPALTQLTPDASIAGIRIPASQAPNKDADQSDTLSNKQSDLSETREDSLKGIIASGPHATELNEKILTLEDKIRTFEESETEYKRKIDELNNKISSLETKNTILKEQNTIANSKIVTLVQTLKMIEEEYKSADERNIELENQNNEMAHMLEELEAKVNAANTTFSILPLLDGQRDNAATAGLQTATDSSLKIPAVTTNVNSQELNTLLETLRNSSAENELIKKRNAEMQAMVKELMGSYKTLVEKELPDLEAEHKFIVGNMKKADSRADFAFNERLITIVNEYLFKNEKLETEMKGKNSLIEGLNEEIKTLKKDFRDKIVANQRKMKVLVNCVDSLSKFTEELMMNNMSQQAARVEVNLGQPSDLMSSMIGGPNLNMSMMEGNKSKIIKVIKGETKAKK